MKKKPVYVAVILFGITLIVTAFTALTATDHTQKNTQMRITASFYPVYIAALNITQDVDGIALSCLSQPTTGCLHDYQLTPQDMMVLEQTDLFLINGAGMEGYLDHVTNSLPELKVFDASAGIALLESKEEHHHDHEAEEGSWEVAEKNAHYWLDPHKYIQEIQNITSALSLQDPARAEQYAANAEQYIASIQSLIHHAQALFSNMPQRNVITFHESFAYLCDFLNLSVVHGVTIEGETTLSAGQTRELVDEARESHVQVLLADNQYSLSIPIAVSKEANVPYLALDACVKGGDEADAYLSAMEKNLDALKEVLNLG